jgi:hypothetical protein
MEEENHLLLDFDEEMEGNEAENIVLGEEGGILYF